VAGTLRLEHAVQPGDVPLHQVHSIPRRGLAPHGIDHLLPADRPACLQRQHGEHHPLLNRPKI